MNKNQGNQGNQGNEGERGGEPLPSVNRMVHYMAPYSDLGGTMNMTVARAAVITEVEEPGNPHSSVGLFVIAPNGSFFARNVMYGGLLNPPPPGTWVWAPRVGPVEGSGQDQGDGMGEGEGVSDGGRDAYDRISREHKAQLERVKAVVQATPAGSVYAGSEMPRGTSPLAATYMAGETEVTLHTTIMLLRDALNKIYAHPFVGGPPEKWGTGDHDSGQVGGWYQEYVAEVRKIARGAWEASK